MIFSGLIQPRYKEIVKDMNLEIEIGKRKKLSLEEYEEIHENKRHVDENILDSKKEFILIDIKNKNKNNGKRTYKFNE